MSDTIASFNGLSKSLSTIDAGEEEEQKAFTVSIEQVVINSSSTNTDCSQCHGISDEKHEDVIVANNNHSKKPNNLLRKGQKKKKSWYSSFGSTYKKKAAYFRKIFQELPSDEMLIVDYSCALQREILVQGRMYLTADHVCFYGNLIIWETARVCLPFKDIVAITKEKTAIVIPNAVEIRMKDSRKYFFASFTSRDKAYLMMFRAWQHCLLDQKLSVNVLWSWVKQSYGNHLGSDSEENESGSRENISSVQSDVNTVLDTASAKSATSIDEDEDEESARKNSDQNTTLIAEMKEAAESGTEIFFSPNDVTESDEEDENDSDNELSKQNDRDCLCGRGMDDHYKFILLNRVYQMTLKDLFECLFAENSFSAAYRGSRNVHLEEMSEWVEVVPGDRRTMSRYLTYTVVSNLKILGSVLISSHEKQTCHRISDDLITIESTVQNSNIPYSDKFYICTKHCLIATDSCKTSLRICCEVKYNKSIWALTKSVIERNTIQALQDTYDELDKRLRTKCSKSKKKKQGGNRRSKIKRNCTADASRRQSMSKQPPEAFESNTNSLSTSCSKYKKTVKSSTFQSSSNEYGVKKGVNGLLSSVAMKFSFLHVCVLLAMETLTTELVQKHNELDRYYMQQKNTSELIGILSMRLKEQAISKLKMSELIMLELTQSLTSALQIMKDIGQMVIESTENISNNISSTSATFTAVPKATTTTTTTFKSNN